MSENTPGSSEIQPPGRGTSLLELMLSLARRKHLVFGVPLLAGIVTLLALMVAPKWYMGTTKILPPQQAQSNAVAILGQLGALAGGATQAFGLKNPSDVYVAMLKSRTVSDNLIRKFDLTRVYGEELLVDARKELAELSEISAGRDGIITINVEDRDPKRAADLANGYVEELRNLTVNLAVTEAGQRRLFFEGQLKKAKADLTAAEAALAQFTREAGLVNPQGQLSLSVAAAASLRAQIAAKEVQLAATRSFATEANPDAQRIRQEIAGLRAELAKMEKQANVGKGDVFMPFDTSAEVTMEYVRRYRELKFNEVLFEILAKQYEIARIDESKDATLIQVLDVAVVPERKSRPKRLIVLIAAVLAATVLASALAIALESLEAAQRDPKFAQTLRALRSALRLRR